MKTNWNYTGLAKAYLKRADYAPTAIDAMLDNAQIQKGAHFCDVGAGVAHLTIPLLERGMTVVAVEPNDDMRNVGIERTRGLEKLTWCEGTGENTTQPDSLFDMVTFGSSFNVTDRQKALKETARILKPKGWFAAMWNHRDLNDPIQSEIENIIKSMVSDYNYGTRREDQSEEIKKSGIFDEVQYIEGTISYSQNVVDTIEAWRSHATLERQAGDKFSQVVDEISKYLDTLGKEVIEIPYTTRLWTAQLI